MCTPSQPSAGGRSGSSSPLREGETASRDGSRLDRRWRCRTAHRPAGRPTGPPPPRSGARHPSGRIAGWERPRSGGEDGAVRLHPPRCRLRHAEMGGRSQPRTRSVDRHRRSAGRGATASVPAICTIGAVSGRTAIPCPATPKVSRTRRTCHLHPQSGGRYRARDATFESQRREVVEHRLGGHRPGVRRAAQGPCPRPSTMSGGAYPPPRCLREAMARPRTWTAWGRAVERRTGTLDRTGEKRWGRSGLRSSLTCILQSKHGSVPEGGEGGCQHTG